MEGYYSSCCGTQVHHDAVDYQRCPSCKESCDVVKESDEEQAPVEYVVVEMQKFHWDSLRAYHQLVNDIDYKLKEVKVKDNFFDNDPMHSELKKASLRAYKQLMEYEFKHRHNIK
jgi:hypothetical protein